MAKKKAPKKKELENKLKALEKKVEKRVMGARPPGRPTIQEEFRRLCGISYEKRQALIDNMMKQALDFFEAGECTLEDINKYIKKAIWPLLFQEYKDGLSGNQQSRQFLINKIVANAQIKIADDGKAPELVLQFKDKDANKEK